MSTKETTAGQWSVRPLNPYQAQIIRDGKQVATVGGFGMDKEGQAEAIADGIVRAVNAHDELVSACNRIVAYFDDPRAAEESAERATDGNTTALEVVLDAVRAALAKVGGAV